MGDVIIIFLFVPVRHRSGTQKRYLNQSSIFVLLSNGTGRYFKNVFVRNNAQSKGALMPLVLDLAKYPLPSYLEGRCTPAVYCKWLNKRSWDILVRDKKRHKPYASTATVSVYKGKINAAVTASNGCDPYP